MLVEQWDPLALYLDEPCADIVSFIFGHVSRGMLGRKMVDDEKRIEVIIFAL